MRRMLYRSATALLPGQASHARTVREYVGATPERAAQISNQLLYRYLKYCQTYSTFWRENWPSDAKRFYPDEAPSVLRALPCIGKGELRTHMDDLRIAPETRIPGDGYPAIRSQRVERSGGSTGAPIKLYVDSHFSSLNRASIDYFYACCGLVPGEPFIFAWGSVNELNDVRKSFRKRVSSWLRGMHTFPCYSLDARAIDQLADLTHRLGHIDTMMIFASAAETVTNYAEASGVQFRRVKRAIVGGGVVHSRLRALIQKHLADEVFDLYGSRDFGLIGCETPAHDGLSIAAWMHTVEVLTPDGTAVQPGETGQLHITAMQNFSTALIRVAMGDTATWYADAGRNVISPGPRIVQLHGRTAEVLVGPAGIAVDPSAVIHTVGVVMANAWLRKFQLVQHSPYEYVLRVEIWPGAEPVELESTRVILTEHLRKLMRAAVNVRIDVVEHIAPLPSGKHQYCVNAQTTDRPHLAVVS